MSEAQQNSIVESLLAQQSAAFGPKSLDEAVKRLESAAKLTGLFMHTASDIWCCEIEMMSKGSRQLAAVTESFLGEADPEHNATRPAETVKAAVEETIQEFRHLNDLMRNSSFELYDAFVKTLIPATPAPTKTPAPKAAARAAERLTTAA
ncbi:hypothetical protein GCM10011611_34740 [Aliidongia dinghuensis]|uniref:Phasin domain-containing protein n=1 Tax=Aliidongia dinghuensis TaxID=1867774 RepID=A0A8J2YV52_9PROT|nr:hypothetical protein [Aliidongia dinghuensis]GGF25703.1 hypothetical protein GCM10011611_34740 [Aliidongia dinghuensis]